MDLRTCLQGGGKWGSPTLLVGDSLLKGVGFAGTKCCWPGADLETVFNLAKMLTLPSTRSIIFHAGTNNVPRFKPFTRGQKLRGKDGTEQVTSLKRLTAKFSQLYQDFREFEEAAGKQPADFHFSEILFRHCNAPILSSRSAKGPGTKLGRGQSVALGLNSFVAKLALQDEFLTVIPNPEFRNPSLFLKDGLHTSSRAGRILEHKFDAIQSQYHG